MALPAISARRAAAVSIWPRWRRSAWIRGSNGASEPRAASSDSAPVTRAERKRRLGFEEAGQGVGGRELRAVEKGEAFFRREHDRLEARFGKRLGRRQHAVADEHFADADHRSRHVGERREVARGAGRALRGNDRRHAAGEHRLDEVERFRLSRPRRPGRGCRASAPSSAASWRSRAARRRRPRATARCCAGASQDRRLRSERWRVCRSRC